MRIPISVFFQQQDIKILQGYQKFIGCTRENQWMNDAANVQGLFYNPFAEYWFAGWSLTEDSIEIDYYPGETDRFYKDVDLYATNIELSGSGTKFDCVFKGDKKKYP